MKTQILILGLFIGLLLGCNATKPESPDKTEFDSVSFPQKSCGDSLPVDSKVYPIKTYPVFINYNESNLKLITSEFCQDANKKIRKKTGKDAIQVASFVSLERANQFQEFMKKKLGSGEVGEPSLITARGTPEPTGSLVKPEVNIGEAAKLTPKQIYQINSIHRKAVVPTYIPSGFEVDKVEIDSDQVQIKLNVFKTKKSYRITYRNPDDLCFDIVGMPFIPSGGGAPFGDDKVEVNSPALGKVTLRYMSFSQMSKESFVGFEDYVYIDNNTYFFGHSQADHCKSISVKEAVEIVESLQYLNP